MEVFYPVYYFLFIHHSDIFHTMSLSKCLLSKEQNTISKQYFAQKQKTVLIQVLMSPCLQLTSEISSPAHVSLEVFAAHFYSAETIQMCICFIFMYIIHMEILYVKEPQHHNVTFVDGCENIMLLKSFIKHKLLSKHCLEPEFS